jgi:hypothetical protein
MNTQDKIRQDVETKVAKINADAEKEAMEKIMRERAGRHTLPAMMNGIQHKRSTSRRSRSRSRKASQGFAHTSGRVNRVEEDEEEEEEKEGDEDWFIRGGKGEQDDRVVKIRDV